ncbi:hypothetical protein MsAg5_07030 [Methanosarcinaceae archaeon Ag5]|uniref:Methyltransferase n=1 Tax=Methanolapillus africanus TaxID=3028297 RepID=A0AAE4SDK0_9EURY|nr:hypothetical protein [Methanosarcinaceae archaeon Ag5]
MNQKPEQSAPNIPTSTAPAIQTGLPAADSKEMRKLIGLMEQFAVLKHATVAMGVRQADAETIECARRAVEQGYADVVLVGNRAEIEKASASVLPADAPLPFEIVDTDEPEEEIVSMLMSGKVDAAIRGTAKASDSLSNLKRACDINEIHRIAILLTKQGNPYFFAPVGIDEGTTAEDKVKFICLGTHLLRRVGVMPCVGLITTPDDAGKEEAAIIIREMKKRDITVIDYGLNLEKAFENSNYIIAPNGISGNLIFRALTFLGGGDGLGAPILMDHHVFVDTSRSAGHYTKAIMVASALSKKREYKE